MKLNSKEIIYLSLAVKERFKCKKIATKPDAKSWSIEQDFLNGVESILKLKNIEFPEVFKNCQKMKKSVTTLTFKNVEKFK